VPQGWLSRFGQETVAASEMFISRIRKSIFKHTELSSDNTTSLSISSLVGGLDGDTSSAAAAPQLAARAAHAKVSSIMRDVKLK
jgi:hypothetical protein